MSARYRARFSAPYPCRVCGGMVSAWLGERMAWAPPVVDYPAGGPHRCRPPEPRGQVRECLCGRQVYQLDSGPRFEPATMQPHQCPPGPPPLYVAGVRRRGGQHA